jgi:hypothetical protein
LFGCSSSESSGDPSAGAAAGGAAAAAGKGGAGQSGSGASGGTVGSGGAAGATSAGTGGGGGDAGAAGAIGGAPVPVFVAQGHHGRLTISCDGGQSWIHNKSADDALRCFSNDKSDCNHSPNAGRGIAYGNNVFAITWGWGAPGTQQRSTDAKNWEDTATNAPTYADIAFGNGKFVGASDPVGISTDGGSWQQGGRVGIDMNIRSIDFIAHDGGRFIITGESGDRHTIMHSADTESWQTASDRENGCGSGYQGMAYGNGAAVLASAGGYVCYSLDGGDEWKKVDLPGDVLTSNVIWTGTEFMVWDGATLHRSDDGQAWTNERTVPENIAIGTVARGEDGSFVAANWGWTTWYDQQRFFRSTDGKNWEVLAQDKFVGSHPIQFIHFGYVEPGAGCPAAE